MRLKLTNQHLDYHGFCDDWHSATHSGVYDDECELCNNEFEDEDEFLELTCTHIFHTHCIRFASYGADHTCTTCGTVHVNQN